jgi:hypothetical protein
MKNKIICCLIPFLLLGCSNQQQATSSALPFTVTTVLTPETKELDDIRNQAMTFLKAKDYDKLDELAATFRSSKQHYADGFWKLTEFYYALAVSNNIYGLQMYNNITDSTFTPS